MRVRRGDYDFEVPDEWWASSGMIDFRPSSDHYDVLPPSDARLVTLVSIATINRCRESWPQQARRSEIQNPRCPCWRLSGGFASGQDSADFRLRLMFGEAPSPSGASFGQHNPYARVVTKSFV